MFSRVYDLPAGSTAQEPPLAIGYVLSKRHPIGRGSIVVVIEASFQPTSGRILYEAVYRNGPTQPEPSADGLA
ncbi:hypothetical protein TMatcc_002574 [Talaromyces marneffei ATCC 18224]